MRKGFFSYVAITLVALVLFLTVSYLYAFNDHRDAAKYDLEVRRTAERMDDLRFALNRTLIDAISDSAYEAIGCGIPINYSEITFCGNVTNKTSVYLDALAAAFTDEVRVNLTRGTQECVPAATGKDIVAALPTGTSIVGWNGTVKISETLTFYALSPSVSYVQTLGYEIYADVAKRHIPDEATGALYFGVRLNNTGVNGTFKNYTVFVAC